MVVHGYISNMTGKAEMAQATSASTITPSSVGVAKAFIVTPTIWHELAA